MKRIDERDVMFSRMSYKEGTPQYEDYYKLHPERKEEDDRLRAMPNIGGEGTATFDPILSPFGDAAFMMLDDMKKYVDGPVSENRQEINPQNMSIQLKKLAQYAGAKLVGITELKPEYYYSVRGRNPESYGEEIEDFHKYGLVFAVEMDKDMINRAPRLEEMFAVTKGYIDAAVVGMWISYYIRTLGYEARNHMDGNYLMVAPLVAQAAGLGEIGRNGLLITKEYGQRVRLGIVSTNMPLVSDEMDLFGVEDFCKVCNICSRTCPGKCISKEDPVDIDGTVRWQIVQEKCYEVWRKLGTDCGVCLSACPFSQGIDERVDRLSEPGVIEEVLADHKEKYGMRNYILKPLDIIVENLGKKEEGDENE